MRRQLFLLLALTAIAGAGFAAAELSASPAAVDVHTTVTTIQSKDSLAPAPPLRFVYAHDPGDTDVYVRVRLVLPVTKGFRRDLDHLVTSWYGVGVYGGFGPYLTYLDGPQIRNGGRELSWFVDAGAAGRLAFVPLASAVQGLAYIKHVRVMEVRVVDT